MEPDFRRNGDHMSSRERDLSSSGLWAVEMASYMSTLFTRSDVVTVQERQGTSMYIVNNRYSVYIYNKYIINMN